MKDIKITIVLPNNDETIEDISYIVSKILEKSGIDNLVEKVEEIE